MSLPPALLYRDQCPFPSSVTLWPIDSSRNSTRPSESEPTPTAACSASHPHRVLGEVAQSSAVCLSNHIPCHDRRAGLPCSVQFNFSMEPCWWKLCGSGLQECCGAEMFFLAGEPRGWIHVWMGGRGRFMMGTLLLWPSGYIVIALVLC